MDRRQLIFGLISAPLIPQLEPRKLHIDGIQLLARADRSREMRRPFTMTFDSAGKMVNFRFTDNDPPHVYDTFIPFK